MQFYVDVTSSLYLIPAEQINTNRNYVMLAVCKC